MTAKKIESTKKERTLREATVQEIQLELIRRNSFNDFDGEKVLASLIKHRKLWKAVLLDRPGVADYDKPCNLLTSGLIKLRDLDDNLWNVDTLYILTKSKADARKLAKIADKENWIGEVYVHTDEDEIGRALGAWRHGYGLVTVWWD